MAKLIGHIFDPQKGGYSAIEIDGLKETAKQFARTADTTEAPPRTLCEYWCIMPKNQLGELWRGWSGTFTMYALQEDMPRFKELVIARLEASADHQRKQYEAAVAALEAARCSEVKKYSWDFNGEAEHWGNDPYDTVEECIDAARQAVAEQDYRTDTPPEVVYIGENIPFVPWVDPEYVLDNMMEQAADFAGDLGGDWDACDYKKRDELTELADSLSNVVNEWLKKYGYEPTFYAVQNIKSYQL